MAVRQIPPVRRYRMVPTPVDAVQFDGTGAGVERVVAWAGVVAPGLPIRPRTEYAGWDDPTGHLEIEVKGADQGCAAGDWIVLTRVDDRMSVWIVDEATFHKHYEEIGD